MDLLDSQKKQIFEILVENSFNPRDFDWVFGHPEINGKATVLLHKEIKYFFAFNYEPKGFYSLDDRYENINVFSPGDTDLIVHIERTDWKSQINNFEIWLKFLQRELKVGNPWENISDYIPSSEINLNENNVYEKFSSPEVQQIEESLNKFKGVLLERYELTVDQLEIVNQKIDYLCDSAKRSIKIDWKNILVGTMIQLFINIGMNAQQVQGLWQYLYACFVKLLS